MPDPRGILVAALLGGVTIGLAAAGVLIIIPALIYQRWRRRMHVAVPDYR